MGLRKAVDEACKACIFDPLAEGTWRRQVFECTAKNCPLYNYRPTPRVAPAKAVKINPSSDLSPNQQHSEDKEAA